MKQEEYINKEIEQIPVGSLAIHTESFNIYKIIAVDRCSKTECYFICQLLNSKNHPTYFNVMNSHLMNFDKAMSYLSALTIVDIFIDNWSKKDSSYNWVKDRLNIHGIEYMLSSAITKLQNEQSKL